MRTWCSLYPDPIAPQASITVVNLNVISLTWRKYRACYRVRRSWSCTRLHWCLVTLEKPNKSQLAKYRHNLIRLSAQPQLWINLNPCAANTLWNNSDLIKQTQRECRLRVLPVAILDWKNWEATTGPRKKVGGQHKCLSCMVIFRCNEDWFASIKLIKPNIGLWISSELLPESLQIV